MSEGRESEGGRERETEKGREKKKIKSGEEKRWRTDVQAKRDRKGVEQKIKRHISTTTK
jgi:hypothetical protein